MSKSGWEVFLPSPGFPAKVQGKEGQPTPDGGNKVSKKDGRFLISREMFWEIILLDTVLYLGN